MRRLFKSYKINKSFIFLFILLLFFSFIWFFLYFNFSTMWGQDSYWYVRLAENLKNGKGYTLEGNYPHAQYPPGLPLLIIFFNLFISNIINAGLFMVFILSLFSIILIYKVGKELGENIGIFSATLLTFHNLFIFHSISVLTEIPFLFFSTLGLYLFMKSYEKRILIIPAAACISFSALIRYDGLLLIFPIAFYMFLRKKDFEDFFFSKKTFIAIGVALLILGSWFLRNFIVFGNPLPNMHSSGDGSTGLSLINLYQFGFLFFKTGYLFPFLVLVGIFLSFTNLKEKKELKTYLVWLLVYFLLHSWWWARSLRFYTEILSFLCFFSAIGLFYLFNLSKERRHLKILFYLIFIVLFLEQIFIFYSGSILEETTFVTLNRYNPIKQISEYTIQNLPKDAVLVVPEWVVYTTFIKDRKVLDYRSGFNYLLTTNKTIYFFTDNLHSWLVDPFYPKEGKINLQVQTQQGFPIKVEMKAQEIKTFEKQIKDRKVNATLWKIEGFEIIS